MKIQIGSSTSEDIVFDEEFDSPPYVILTPMNNNSELVWSCNVKSATSVGAKISCYYRLTSNGDEWVKYNNAIQYIAIGFEKSN